MLSTPLIMVAALLFSGGQAVVFLLYLRDKRAARTGGWRTPERTLLMASLLLGCTGALLAMLLVRHKVKRYGFMMRFGLVWVLRVAVATVAALLLL